MPVTVSTIDPVTRLEGHLKVKVSVDTVKGVQQVVDAWSTGTLFRGFEKLLVNRSPQDAQHLTERICGVCPVSHALSAVLAQEAAVHFTPPANARIMRNLILGSNFLQSHILHFYFLALPDFADGPAMAPWQPASTADKRFDRATSQKLADHLTQAIDMRRRAHEAAALFGGRMPHPPSFLAGGVTATPRPDRLTSFKNAMNELVAFIQNVYLPDVELIAGKYADYLSIGAGPRNLLAFGGFELDDAASSKLFRRGRIVNASPEVQALDVNAITEHVSCSWFDDTTNNLNPAEGDTLVRYPKPDAYSWMKAPRYQGACYEAGPLARMWVNGDYRRGISVMDRHRARAQEALKLARAMLGWVGEISGTTSYRSCAAPVSGRSQGLTEAPRGAIGHWVEYKDSKISRYQVVSPTCWNCSPRDSKGARGPLEQALIGTPVKDLNDPVEVTRVVHSYDPCLSCAVHVMRPEQEVKVFALGHYHSEEELHADSHAHPHGHLHGEEAPRN